MQNPTAYLNTYKPYDGKGIENLMFWNKKIIYILLEKIGREKRKNVIEKLEQYRK